ncbi:MAG: hypothetical protein U0L18_08655 [Acutalibacteraceae bacterium]|nr:hypothetical protein [Acutalibacteraceae bacterium]
MRVNNNQRLYKIFYAIFTTFLLILIVALVISSVILNDSILDFLFINVYFSFEFLLLLLVTFYSFGYNIIDENGITRCFLFYKKRYSWNDLQFISKSRTYIKCSRGVYEKVLVSVKIPKEDFKRRHTCRLFSKKCFYMPYSKELESYIIAKAPIDCYTYSYIVDDTTNPKYDWI